jgi:CHASE2 domain-containing sensor protein
VTVAPELEAAGVSVPQSPYVGLVPYDEADAAFFFGRSTEAAIIAANLRAARLTIVYGPSGVGKSSLLNAGVVHRLRSLAQSTDDDDDDDDAMSFAVCAFRSWSDDPVEGLTAAARAALEEAACDPLPAPSETLPATLRAWTDRAGRLLLVLDQFEEYFQYHSDESDGDLSGFAAGLARIVNDPTLQVHVLLSLREDALARLDCFKGRVPALFSNYLRVDHLDLDAAREAVEGPLDAWNATLPDGAEPYGIEPELTEAVLAAALGSSLSLVTGGDTPAATATARDRVEAPFLQLVLERLWRATVADGDHTLTLARLEALGGAVQIVQNHLLDALARLAPAEKGIASDCFRFLVSSGRTKMAQSPADLAEWVERPEPEVTAVLDKLCSGEGGRVLRAVAPARGEGSPTYELFHDVLADPILAWRRGFEEQRDRRRRFIVSILAAFLGIAVALAALSTHLLGHYEVSSIATRFSIRGSGPPPKSVVVVAIDAKTFGDFRNKLQWPFPRRYHARVINNIAAGHPKAIAIDIQFTEPTDVSDDNALITSVARARNVILAATEVDTQGRTNVFGGYLPPRTYAASPLLPVDSDNAIRRMADWVDGIPTFALVAAAVAHHQAVPRPIGVSGLSKGSHWIDFAGPPGKVKTYSYSDVYFGKIPPSAFTNKVVVIGPSAPSLQDLHSTTVGPLMPGAEVQANAIETALRGFPLRSVPNWLNVFFVVLLGMLPVVVSRLRATFIVIIALAAGALYAVAVQIAFDHNWIASLTYPLVALGLSTASIVYPRVLESGGRGLERLQRFTTSRVRT